MNAPAMDLAGQIEAEHQAAIGAARSAIEHAIRCGELLIAQKASIGHGEWLTWVEANLSFGDRQARKYMRVAANAEQVLAKRNCGSDLGINEALELIASAGRDNAHFRTLGTGENEWFTPPEYIDLARQVLGEIDLDPATCEAAQARVKASRYFTIQTDGLKHDWHGRVWCNPPYAQPVIEHFAKKIVGEFEAGRVAEAIMLTHNCTDTAWFHIAERACAALCFTRGRTGFERFDGIVGSPVQGQAFFYYGARTDLFRSVFGEIGFVR